MGECVCVSLDYVMGNVSGFLVKPIPEIHSAVGDLKMLLKIYELSQEMSQKADLLLILATRLFLKLSDMPFFQATLKE